MAREHGFVRRFEGRQVLAGLLDVAGSPYSPEQVVERMREGYARGEAPSSVIPGLFPLEPRFPDPSYAKQLYQNLLGLWDLVGSGDPLSLDRGQRSPRPRKQKPSAPTPFGAQGPDDAFVETAWRYLEDLDKRGRDRLQDAFENRQDALRGFLEEQGLSDSAFACARHLVFELFAMIALGWPPGTRPVLRSELEGEQVAQEDAPPALRDYAEEALFEAAQEDEEPLRGEELARVREVVARSLLALWAARRTS
ncbi:MAG TPA: hypothetical protein VKE49_08705 [Myxococcaceae bacterium]|nr:hypothetical protein [Myxococcaceae bacterium]